MRLLQMTMAALAMAGLAVTASAQSTLRIAPEARQQVFKSIVGPGADQAPIIGTTDGGFFDFVGAPAQASLEVRVPAPLKAANTPEETAAAYFSTHAGAFGILSSNVTLAPLSTRSYSDRTVVVQQQLVKGVPVFGAETTAVFRSNGALDQVSASLLIDTRPIDTSALPVTPRVSKEAAEATASAAIAQANAGVPKSRLKSLDASELVIYHPPLLGIESATRLAWHVRLRSSTFPVVQEGAFVDAHSGDVIYRYNLNTSQLPTTPQRAVFDANGAFSRPFVPNRSEGGPATGIGEVDYTYDVLGETFNFYLNQHNYNANRIGGGGPRSLQATVRVPFFNAFWDGREMFFGTGLATDDIVAHEMTHGVTQDNSNLVYLAVPGAINESLSDVWGEFVDLTNGTGDDSPEVRWQLGEDIPDEILQELDPEGVGAIRNMQDPTLTGQPDRLGSPLFFPVNSTIDNGGVHINSGILNKMCYLLTDGDSFNGYEIAPLGIETTAQLFWGAQTRIGSSATFQEVYLAMAQEAAALGLSFDTRINLSLAARAVEIFPPSLGSLSFRAIPVSLESGGAAIALIVSDPKFAQPLSNIYLRGLDTFPTFPRPENTLAEGPFLSYLDFDALPGEERFYTVYSDLSTGGLSTLFDSATAGTPKPLNFLTETFSRSTTSPAGGFDLSFSQLTFTPVGAPTRPEAGKDAPFNQQRYQVTRRAISQLPVAPEAEGTEALYLPPTEDGVVSFRFTSGQTIPFFGERASTFYVSSNGYVSFQPVGETDPENFASEFAHFSSRRVSPLFADLSPATGGTVWLKELADRLVVTYQNVPEFRLNSPFAQPSTNTFQVEMFFTGVIRFSYLQVNTLNAIVGISDGRGVPVDPATLFPNVTASFVTTDFTAQFDAVPDVLYFEPVTPPLVQGGDRVQLTVRSVAPGAQEPAVLTATWTEEGPAPFADLANGTGLIDYTIPDDFSGTITIRVRAFTSEQEAYIDIPIIAGFNRKPPQAINLSLRTDRDTGSEDISRNRRVPTEASLFADYEYFHPQRDLSPSNAEGPTFVLWRRNNQVVTGFNNVSTVPAIATFPEDQWYFSVIPISADYVIGEEVFSPILTIDGGPSINSVAPNFGLVGGNEEVTITGTRFEGVTQVLFGNVPARSYRVFDRETITAITPVRTAGTVEVSVRTTGGTATLNGAYTYVTDLANLLSTDVNRDGKVDATDVQIVVTAVLDGGAEKVAADTNGDGRIDAADIQYVVNDVLDN